METSVLPKTRANICVNPDRPSRACNAKINVMSNNEYAGAGVAPKPDPKGTGGGDGKYSHMPDSKPMGGTRFAGLNLIPHMCFHIL
jgi:hypothetical protein